MSLARWFSSPTTLPNGAAVGPLRLGDLAVLEQWCGRSILSAAAAERLASQAGLAAVLDQCAVTGQVLGHFASEAIWQVLCDINNLPQRPARVNAPPGVDDRWPAVIARRLGCLPDQLAGLTPHQVLALLGWQDGRLACESADTAMAMLAQIQPADAGAMDQATRFARGLAMRIWQMQWSSRQSSDRLADSAGGTMTDHPPGLPTVANLIDRLERLVLLLTDRPPSVFGA